MNSAKNDNKITLMLICEGEQKVYSKCVDHHKGGISCLQQYFTLFVCVYNTSAWQIFTLFLTLHIFHSEKQDKVLFIEDYITWLYSDLNTLKRKIKYSIPSHILSNRENHNFNLTYTVEKALAITSSSWSPAFTINCLWHPCVFTICFTLNNSLFPKRPRSTILYTQMTTNSQAMWTDGRPYHLLEMLRSLFIAVSSHVCGIYI